MIRTIPSPQHCGCHSPQPGRPALAGYLDAQGNYQDGTNPDPTYGGQVSLPDYGTPDQTPLTYATGTSPAASSLQPILNSLKSLNAWQIGAATLGGLLLFNALGNTGGRRRR